MAQLQNTKITGSLLISSSLPTVALVITGSSYFTGSNFMVSSSNFYVSSSNFIFKGESADFSGVGTVTLGANVTATAAPHTHDINNGTTTILSASRGGTGQSFVSASTANFSMPVITTTNAITADGKSPAAGEVPEGIPGGVIPNEQVFYRASMIVASGSNWASKDWKMAINSAVPNPLYTLFVSGNLGVFSTITEMSTRNIKQNIAELGDELSNVKKLIPVQYEYIGTGKPSIGFIAEEFNDVYPSLVVCDENGNPNSIAYANLVSPIVKAIQQLSEKLDDLTKRVEDLENK